MCGDNPLLNAPDHGHIAFECTAHILTDCIVSGSPTAHMEQERKKVKSDGSHITSSGGEGRGLRSGLHVSASRPNCMPLTTNRPRNLTSFDPPPPLALANRFDFLSVPLCHPRYRRTFGAGAPERAGLFTRSDMVLKGSDWSRFVVGRCVFTEVRAGDEQQFREGGDMHPPKIESANVGRTSMTEESPQ